MTWNAREREQRVMIVQMKILPSMFSRRREKTPLFKLRRQASYQGRTFSPPTLAVHPTSAFEAHQSIIQ
jgi:hypothetical protein